jgi:hypothetical protein
MVNLHGAEKALAENDAKQLWKELVALFPDQRKTRWAQQLVRYAVSDAAPPPPSRRGPERLFLESIVETKRRLQGGRPHGLKHFSIGADFDFLYDVDGILGWTIPRLLNFLLLGRIQPRRQAVVVGTMRDDGIYILEWVSHYLVLGFDHVIIYTNDNLDGSEVLLRLLAKHGVITLIEGETSGAVPPEGKAFGHALHLLHELRDFEWALFVDSDEYLVPSPKYGNSVSNVLADVRQRFGEKIPSGICYHWLWFISGMAYARTPQLLQERFQHARPHRPTKCLARIQDVLSMRRDHFPDVKDGGVLVNSIFDPVDETYLWENRVPEYGGGRINHYWPRSFEEFALRKARGATLKMEENLFDRPFERFFQWNGMECPENHYPTDPVFLTKIKAKIQELELLEGVRAEATKLSLNFPDFLKRIYGDQEVRQIYEDSKREPTDL